jgi:curved DNA-binding protein
MAVPFQDYYEIMSVKRDATLKEIKSAYRKLARKWHPDLHSGDEKAVAEEKIKKINEAYEVLGDKEKREKYDRLGSNWQNGQDFEPSPNAGAHFNSSSDFAQGGFSDFFETLFGGQGGATFTRGAGTRRPQRGEDYEYQIDLTLEDAYLGTQRSIQFSGGKACPECGGSGVRGRGFCSRCGGTGNIPEQKTLDVKIPAGVDEGNRIRLKGQGSEGVSGGERGDLFLKVHLLPHLIYTLKGSHLEADLALRPEQAVLGDKVFAPTLDGPVLVTVPPGSHAGMKLRLLGKGLPAGGGRGNEFLRLVIDLPRDLSDEERNIYRQLKELRKGR